jgi:hypothetical protein
VSVPGQAGHGLQQGEPAQAVLVVDVPNVAGSRADGWWRDRAGAATRLLDSLAGLRGATVVRPDGAGAVRHAEVVAVVEGAARSVAAPDTVAVVSAAQDGDREIVAQARRIVAAGHVPLVVTADRGQRRRLPSGSEVAGPEWLNRMVGR